MSSSKQDIANSLDTGERLIGGMIDRYGTHSPLEKQLASWCGELATTCRSLLALISEPAPRTPSKLETLCSTLKSHVQPYEAVVVSETISPVGPRFFSATVFGGDGCPGGHGGSTTRANFEHAEPAIVVARVLGMYAARICFCEGCVRDREIEAAGKVGAA